MTSEKDLPTNVEDNKESLFQEFLEEGQYDYQRPQRGEVRDGIILRKDTNQIIVDIGAKREGIVPETDLEKLGPEAVAELGVGDEVLVYVLKPENRDGDVIVSINLARQLVDWDRAEKIMETDEILEKPITGFNKGGLLVQFGDLQGFLPRSHIVNLDGRTKSGPPLERLKQMVGQELPLRIIEVNQQQRRLIFSERAAWREWRAEQKKHLLQDLEVGDVRQGTVTSLADFGAFVDLGGADGLIHLSELSWDRGKRPGDVVEVGDRVDVRVISLDRERQRIGLSLKQLTADPWETIEERYAIGQYIDVEVTNLADFGAFARLEEGIEGLIHISELADHNVKHPSEVVEPRQELTVQILSLEPKRKRIGLSLRRVPEHLRPPAEIEEPEVPEASEAETVSPQETTEAQAEQVHTRGESEDAGAGEPAETQAEPTEEPVETLAEQPTEEPEEQAVPVAATEPSTGEVTQEAVAGDGDQFAVERDSEEMKDRIPTAAGVNNGDKVAEES